MLNLDIVTGKVDVRKAAAQLPRELVEPELSYEEENLTECDEDLAEDTDTIPEEVES